MSANPATAAAVRAAPKTLHQFRNLCYFVAAIWGYRYGSKQRRNNEAEWKTYHNQIQRQNFERVQAVEAAIKARENELHPSKIPEIIPEPLHEVYCELTDATA